MPELSSHWIVETDWLAEHLDAPDIIVVDASLHLPNTGRNARAEYLAEHIPGALFFDIDDIADEESPLPHMLPSTIKFASRVKKMGIGDGVRVIAYDSVGLYSAARAWWMFRTMGHNDVAVLNGGLRKWKAEGRPVEDGEPPRGVPLRSIALALALAAVALVTVRLGSLPQAGPWVEAAGATLFTFLGGMLLWSLGRED